MRHFSSKGEGRCQKRNGNGAKRRVASRGFTGDIRIDIGAYRDLHRHRRCHKFRQSYSGRLGFDTPALVEEAGGTAVYREGMEAALAAMQGLPAPGAHYLLPFGACGRFLGRGYAEAVSGQTSRSVRSEEHTSELQSLSLPDALPISCKACPRPARITCCPSARAAASWVEDMLKR